MQAPMLFAPPIRTIKRIQDRLPWRTWPRQTSYTLQRFWGIVGAAQLPRSLALQSSCLSNFPARIKKHGKGPISVLFWALALQNPGRRQRRSPTQLCCCPISTSSLLENRIWVSRTLSKDMLENLHVCERL